MAYMFLFNIVKETHQIDMYHKYGLAHYTIFFSQLWPMVVVEHSIIEGKHS